PAARGTPHAARGPRPAGVLVARLRRIGRIRAVVSPRFSVVSPSLGSGAACGGGGFGGAGAEAGSAAGIGAQTHVEHLGAARQLGALPARGLTQLALAGVDRGPGDA